MANLPLSETQKKHLRKLGHTLSPTVTIGSQGLKETVIAAINESLEHHELIKIKFRDHDRKSLKQTIADICQQTESENIQSIGFICLLYRKNPDKTSVELPKR